jgi:hypothetical protein
MSYVERLSNLAALLGEAEGVGGPSPLEESKKLTLKDMSRLFKQHMAGKEGYIRAKDNPEWGEWQVVRETRHKGSVWWDIRGDRGGRVLHSGELRFWEEV